MHRVDPAAGQVGEGGEVLRLGQHLRLEPAHGAGRRCAVFDRPTTDDLAHHRIAAEPVGDIDILPSGKT